MRARTQKLTISRIFRHKNWRIDLSLTSKPYSPHQSQHETSILSNGTLINFQYVTLKISEIYYFTYFQTQELKNSHLSRSNHSHLINLNMKTSILSNGTLQKSTAFTYSAKIDALSDNFIHFSLGVAFFPDLFPCNHHQRLYVFDRLRRHHPPLTPCSEIFCDSERFWNAR
jgi:hypothetical protein